MLARKRNFHAGNGCHAVIVISSSNLSGTISFMDNSNPCQRLEICISEVVFYGYTGYQQVTYLPSLLHGMIIGDHGVTST
jgi:hypothetical protein